MDKLNISDGEWTVPHLSQDDVKCNCAYVLCESSMGGICTVHYPEDDENWGDNPPLEEAKANGILIADAGNTYNKCPLRPSELLEIKIAQAESIGNLTVENEELREVLSLITKKSFDLYTHCVDMDFIDPEDETVEGTVELIEAFNFARKILNKN